MTWNQIIERVNFFVRISGALLYVYKHDHAFGTYSVMALAGLMRLVCTRARHE